MKVYLSGPMTGLEDRGRQGFALARQDLRTQGFEVCCPAENSDHPDWIKAERVEHLARDLYHLLEAPIIVALPRWQTSEGAKLEIATAIQLDKELRLYVPNVSLGKMPHITNQDHPWFSTVMFDDLQRFSEEHGGWIEHNFPDQLPWESLVGVVEELGELAHAHLKGHQSIRLTPEEVRAKKQDAVGDILIYLDGYCRSEGFSMGECLGLAWRDVRLRNWKVNRQTGTEEISHGKG